MDIFKRNGFDFVERDAPTKKRGSQQQQQQHSNEGQAQQQRLWSKPPRSSAAAAAAAAAAGAGACEEGELAAAAAAATAAAAAAGGGGLGSTEEADRPQSQEMVGSEDEGCMGSAELLLSAVPVLKGGVSGGESRLAAWVMRA